MKTRYPSTRLIEVVSKYYHTHCDGLSADGMLEIILNAEIGSCELCPNNQVQKLIDVLDYFEIPYNLSTSGDMFFKKWTYFYFSNHDRKKSLTVAFDHHDNTFCTKLGDTSWHDTIKMIIKEYITGLQNKHESECRQFSAYELENRQLKAKRKAKVRRLRKH